MTYAWAAAQAVANGITRVLTASIGFLGNAFKALKAVMMANPWIAAFTILLAVVIALEAKFHIFEKIFEKLSKIDWAGKLAGGLEYISKLWGGLTGKLGSIGSMAKPIMAVTMPGVTLMVGLLKLMFDLAKPFIEAATPAIKYLKDIYNIIKEKFEATIKYLQDIVPDWLKSIFEAVGNFITWVIDKINILLSILGIREKTAKEKEEEAKVAEMTPEERLAYNRTRYAIEQASGGERGLPAVGAGNLSGWTPAFGGKYATTIFKSSRYPGEERLGRDLTEAQLMTGEWTPTTGASEFKAFIDDQKKMQEEAQKEEAEGEKEYTSIFDEILGWAKKIYEEIMGIVTGITDWFSNNLLGPILGIAERLGISTGPKLSEEAITAGFKTNMQQIAQEQGLPPLSEEQLDILQKAAEGKLTYALPPELEPYIGLSGEALKKAKEAPATGAEAGGTTGAEAGGTTGAEAGGTTGAEADKVAKVRQLINEGKLDEAAHYLGLEPNANYISPSGLVESGREKAVRYSEYGEEALKGVSGPGISSETESTTSKSKPSSSSSKKSEKKGTGSLTQRVKEKASEVTGKVEKGVQSAGVKAGEKYGAATSHVGTGVEGGFKEGGIIGGTGKAVVHRGEEVISEEDRAAIREGTIPSILEGIDSLVYRLNGRTLQPLPSTAEPVVNLNFYAPIVKVDKMSSEIDLYKIKSDLVSFLRKEVKSAMKGGM